MRIATAIAAAFLVGGIASAATEKPVTFWVPKGTSVDFANVKLTLVSKEPGTQKLSKACAKNAATFDRWTVLSAGGPSAGTTFGIIAEKLDGKGVRLTSIRPEGECKEGNVTWEKYSALIQTKKTSATGQPATAATPVPATPKREDNKKEKGK